MHTGNCPLGLFGNLPNAPDIFGCTCGVSDYQPKTEDTYFGAKTSRPDDDDALMQTDCGGAIITQFKMTQGQARKLALSIDLCDLHTYLITNPSKWMSLGNTDPRNQYFGGMWVGIYSYLNDRFKLFADKDPENKRYNNAAEFLYNLILGRLVEEGKVTQDKYYYNLIPD